MECGTGRLGVGVPLEGRAGWVHSLPLAFTGVVLRSRGTQEAPGPLCRVRGAEDSRQAVVGPRRVEASPWEEPCEAAVRGLSWEGSHSFCDPQKETRGLGAPCTQRS